MLFLSPQRRQGQIRGLHQPWSQRLAALQPWPQTWANPRRGPRTGARAAKQSERWLTGPYLRHVLKLVDDAQRPGAARLPWWSDHAALTHLATAGFGKRLLSTAQHAWATAEIMLAYRGQSRAEAVFRPRKDVDPLAVRPQSHGTEQKIRVPTFLGL